MSERIKAILEGYKLWAVPGNPLPTTKEWNANMLVAIAAIEEAAYVRGKEAMQKYLRLRLGLNAPGDD